MSECIRCISCDEDNTQPVCMMNGYRVVQCKRCGLEYINPMPEPDKIYELYRRGTLIEESGTEKIGDDGFIIQPVWKVKEFLSVLGHLNKLTAPGRILEVGSLWGLFLRLAREAGWDTHGVEPWSEAAAYCRNKMALNIISGTLEEADFPSGYFDAVVMLDVLEHCPRPRADLAKIHNLLKDGGILCVLTPNAKGLLPLASNQLHRLKKQPWTYLVPPFHLYNFSTSTLDRLLTTQGFQVTSLQHLGIDSRIKLDLEKVSIKAISKKTLSFIGKTLHLGDRIMVYAKKQD
jgi:SAM-dependent methyltransferase